MALIAIGLTPHAYVADEPFSIVRGFGVGGRSFRHIQHTFVYVVLSVNLPISVSSRRTSFNTTAHAVRLALNGSVACHVCLSFLLTLSLNTRIRARTWDLTKFYGVVPIRIYCGGVY